MTILITGNAGYIGSHVVELLVHSNHRVLGFDNLYRGNLENTCCPIIVGDIRNKKDIITAFEQAEDAGNKIDVVMHLAALTSVPESMENKNEYEEVNLEGTETLINVMKDYECNKLIFSSTASIYKQSNEPVNESSPVQPLNNYALTKYFAEQFIKHQDWLNSVIFRYFNVIGYMSGYNYSEEYKKTNIIPTLLRMYQNKDKFYVYGNNYPVKRKNENDHTCVRDYIDVRDVARAHIKAIDYLENHTGHALFNLGTKHGTSVLELLESFEKANSVNIDYEIVDRRKGDPASVIANSRKANELLDWEPEISLIDSLKVLC